MLPEWLEAMSGAMTGAGGDSWDEVGGIGPYWDDPNDSVLDPWEGSNWFQNIDREAYASSLTPQQGGLPALGGVVPTRGEPKVKNQDRFQREKEDRERQKTKMVNIPESRFFRGNADQEVGPWFHKYRNGRIPLKAMDHIMGGYLRGDAASALRAASRAAKKDGVNLTLTGGYRTYAVQVQLKAQKDGLAATPGTSNHGWGLAIDIGEGEQRNWMAKHGREYGWTVLPSESWHFDYMGWDGAIKGSKKVPSNEHRQHAENKHSDPRRSIASRQPDIDPSLAPSLLNLQHKTISDDHVMNDIDWEPIGSADDFPQVMSLTMPTVIRPPQPQAKPQPSGGKGPDKGKDTGGGKTGSGNAPNFGGGRVGRIKEQLYQGFMDAGEPAIARMVGTKDFDRWIMAESGYHQAAKSPANNQGQPNYGLFQFWAGHPWVNKYIKNGQFTATAYEQARLAVRYFNLHAKEIHTYAQQIQNGSYQGWG